MTAPRVHVRLSRAAGWRKPDDVVVVARPTRWGNPFDQREMGRDRAIARYAAWMSGDGPDECRDRAGRRYSRAERLAELPALAGHRLGCWCPPGEPCHADVLAALVAEHEGAAPSPPVGSRPAG
ncbi:conserved hypothetical protein [Frankia canadensis]|uniref:DUF4326 domain-containing protein n=1 Tax=Frankia canadensis TaxID=1836972 RepID=A0A2I2KXE7_9ACTN|nr:DUF4326 domain-containing protein [Frankia canadensis]SNQ50338.1 conserved hypothetical protein [Frankia canadensis]SOU57628.1 conserved hypothetical protein [Frankia canadensis]